MQQSATCKHVALFREPFKKIQLCSKREWTPSNRLTRKEVIVKVFNSAKNKLTAELSCLSQSDTHQKFWVRLWTPELMLSSWDTQISVSNFQLKVYWLSNMILSRLWSLQAWLLLASGILKIKFNWWKVSWRNIIWNFLLEPASICWLYKPKTVHFDKTSY